MEPQTLTCCNGTYHRHDDGWHYDWGDPVPGARDLTLGEALQMLALADPNGRALRPLTEEELERATELCGADRPVAVTDAGRRRLVVGLQAPELSVIRMLTVAEIADLAGVSKATIDSYRYRGYLPEPQIVKGRTPLWTRPVIHHWLDNRPGAGWRTDVYGGRERVEPVRTLPITRARAANGRARALEAARTRAG